LIEVLVVTVILGIISYGLTEIVILTLKTTDATANRVSESTAAQTVGSFFTGDAQSAETVSRADTECTQLDPAEGVVTMSWKDQSVTNVATYAMHRPGPSLPALELLRWSCPGFNATYDAQAISNVSNVNGADNAKVIDATTATASLTTGSPSASLTLDNYEAPALTSGGVIHDATLRVARSSTGTTRATLTPMIDGAPCAPDNVIPNHSDGQIHADTVDLTACGLSDPQQLRRLSVAYSTDLISGPTANDSLDGIVLEFSYPKRQIIGQVSSAVGDPPPVVALCDGLQCPTTGASPARVEIQIQNGGSVSVIRNAATVEVPAGGAFTNPDRAKVVDGSTADAALDGSTPTRSMSLKGYNELPDVLPDSIIDSAILRVTHQDDGDMGPVTVTVDPFPGSTCAPASLNLHPGAVGEDQLDLKACGVTDTARLAGLRVTYSTSLAPLGTAATDHLDGMVLDVTYRPAHTLTVVRRT
jgi:hypothetical protein